MKMEAEGASASRQCIRARSLVSHIHSKIARAKVSMACQAPLSCLLRRHLVACQGAAELPAKAPAATSGGGAWRLVY